ncbi:hypothetical protein LN042_09410 [Kitasatospora sp. RB6PN24]|uniref:hypothetical protein n=1 Tax=Kitasatospora humi TaxID=2893891 RepID=UPI001E450C0D|nr:hypothetical protein [Kitasatospora humi]MCC9307318.1 hypothetical protein [Kitasatospora humi]
MSLRQKSSVRRALAAVTAALAVTALPAALLAAAPGAGASPVHAHAYAPQPDVQAGYPMEYGGGPVQQHPVVYLDFWGSQWQSDTNGVQKYLTNLFNGLGTSQDHWSTITSQYTDYTGTGSTFNGPVLGGSWTDGSSAAPAAASQSGIAREANKAAAHFGVTGNQNAQIVVLSPHGTSPDGWPNSGFCAWHDYTGSVSYTNMPYQLDAPAGSRCPNSALGGKLDAFSIVEGHEYAESISDPQPGGGWTNALGQEIGDTCESNFQHVTLPTGTFAMQPLWSNRAGGCVISG